MGKASWDCVLIICVVSGLLLGVIVGLTVKDISDCNSLNEMLPDFQFRHKRGCQINMDGVWVRIDQIKIKDDTILPRQE